MDFGALDVLGNATLEGDVDSLSLKGEDTITSESLGTRSTYTHTIALGDTYTEGFIFITPYHTGSMGVSWGNMVFLDTTETYAAGAEVYSDFYTRLAGWHDTLSSSRYGTNIRLVNVYLDGTDLKLEFFNLSYSLASVVNAEFIYVVWKA